MLATNCLSLVFFLSQVNGQTCALVFVTSYTLITNHSAIYDFTKTCQRVPTPSAPSSYMFPVRRVLCLRTTENDLKRYNDKIKKPDLFKFFKGYTSTVPLS